MPKILARWVVLICLDPDCRNYKKEIRAIQYYNYSGQKWAFLKCPECGGRNLSVIAEDEFYEFRDDDGHKTGVVSK